MHILQHGLLTFYENRENFSDIISYVLLPDTVRFFTKERKYSHFELTNDGTKINGFIYPSDLSLLNHSYCKSHIINTKNENQAAIGNDTIIRYFDSVNVNLYPLPRKCYRLHLEQDVIFDNFIRNIIDCNNKFDDIFILYDGTKINGAKLRKLISEMENYGVYLLIQAIYKEMKIIINQDWINLNIITKMKKDYKKGIFENTIKFLKLNENMLNEINYFDGFTLDQTNFYKGKLRLLYDELNINY